MKQKKKIDEKVGKSLNKYAYKNPKIGSSIKPLPNISYLFMGLFFLMLGALFVVLLFFLQSSKLALMVLTFFSFLGGVYELFKYYGLVKNKKWAKIQEFSDRQISPGGA